MRSLLQNVQQAVGRAASRIAPPTVTELVFEPLENPTLGFFSDEDLELAQPELKSVPCRGHDWVILRTEIDLALPVQSSVSLPEQADTVLCCLGTDALTFELTSSRWALPGSDLSPLGCGSMPLLDDADESVRAVIRRNSLAPDRFRPLAKPPGLSRDLLRKLAQSQDLPTEDCLALLLARSVVSADLFKPLARKPLADGKRYADEPKNPNSADGVERPLMPPLSFEGNGLGDRKAFEQQRGRVTRGMNVWDLLLPLLQRPITLDLGIVVDLPSALYAYQTKGVEFLIETPSALLGDDMGTGKTVQTSVALRMLFQTGKIKTALIVCPLSVIPNWDRELAKWAANLSVTVVRGDKEHRKICWRQAAHIWLVTYDTLRNDIDAVLPSRKGGFDLVALDEAQRVKNWSSGVTRAVRSLRAKYRWGLSGTPLENNTDELWTILNVVKPELSDLDRAGLLDWSEGIQSVLRPMFLRRRKQDVLTDLPSLFQNPVWLEMEDCQRASYDRLEKEWAYELHSKWQVEERTVSSALVLIGKLKQLCNRCPIDSRAIG